MGDNRDKKFNKHTLSHNHLFKSHTCFNLIDNDKMTAQTKENVN